MNLGELTLNVVRRLGIAKTWTASNGSTVSIVGSTAEISDDEYEYEQKGYLIVSKAGGAAPEFQYSRWLEEGYEEDTRTWTLADALSAAVAAGDEFVVVEGDEWPLYDIISNINDGLRKIGNVPLADTSLTTISNTYEYTLPIGIKLKDILDVSVQSDATYNDYIPLYNWYQSTADAGSQNKLVLYGSLPDAGMTIRITYRGTHPKLDSYDDTVHEAIDEPLAIAASMASLYDWKKNQEAEEVANSTINLYNQWSQEFFNARKEFRRNIPERRRRLLHVAREISGSGAW